MARAARRALLARYDDVRPLLLSQYLWDSMVTGFPAQGGCPAIYLQSHWSH